ncbi:MAG: helicase HerA domain-containing protein, partial [Candidatus Nanohaloarchaea archaeon]
TVEEVEDFIDETGILWKEMNQKLGYSRPDRKFLSYSKYHEEPEKIAEAALELFEEKHDLSEAREKLEELRHLTSSDIHWDEIEEIRRIDYSGWVYDLTVEENHSFTAGFGGIFCHNSYSMGVIAEELQNADISENLSTVIIDPMGIYWSMTRPNDRQASELEDWDLKPEAFDANVFIPEGKTEHFEEREMPYDDTFTLNPAELSSSEWAMAFDLDMSSEAGILLERLVTKIDEEMDDYTIDDMIKLMERFDFPDDVKRRLENRFMNAKDWGIFGDESSLSVLDVSVFGEMSSGWSVRALVVGLLAKKILRERMTARRIEEIDEMEGLAENEMPIVWMLIDEAHEFLPAEGETAASHPLMRWVKIGREPGVSLGLATQQPAKLHPDALSQCDIILSHRLTASQDIDALGNIMHTYM